MIWRTWVAVACVGMLAASWPAEGAGGYEEQEIMGAWDHGTLDVLDATETYGTIVKTIVGKWQAGIQAYATDHGMQGSLGTVALQYVDLKPSGGAPQSNNAGIAWDIIVLDGAALMGIGCSPTGEGCSVGYTMASLGLTQHVPPELRGLSITQRRYEEPAFAILPVGESASSAHNYALHEFGHTLGLGHSYVPDSVGHDAMTPGWPPAAYNCVSSLNLLALAEMYDFLPGPYEEPPLGVTQDTGAYTCPY